MLADFIDFVSDDNLIVNDRFFFKESCWAAYLKETSQAWEEIFNISNRIHRFLWADPWKEDGKCINYGNNNHFYNCPSFMENNLKEPINFLA